MSGTFNLASAQNNAPPLSHEQATKFANYFLSRRSVQTVKGIYSLLDVLNILSSNKVYCKYFGYLVSFYLGSVQI